MVEGKSAPAICPEGESQYIEMYPDVSVGTTGSKPKKGFKSAFDHWQSFGQSEGRIYSCESIFADHNIFKEDLWRPQPADKCSVGEAIYKMQWNHVGKVVAEGTFESAYYHWRHHGNAEGKDYYCEEELKFLKLGNDPVLTKMIKSSEDNSYFQVRNL